jgi:hypothetical protein
MTLRRRREAWPRALLLSISVTEAPRNGFKRRLDMVHCRRAEQPHRSSQVHPTMGEEHVLAAEVNLKQQGQGY